jgi:tryptophan-rich sensory protein
MDETYIQWFESLQKPNWGFDFEILGEFWIIVYPLAVLAFCLTIYLIWNEMLNKRVLCPVMTNLLFSLGFSVLVTLFPTLIFVVFLMVIYAITLGWVLAELANIRHWTALLLLAPYTLWVVIGSVSVFELARLNW